MQHLHPSIIIDNSTCTHTCSRACQRDDAHLDAMRPMHDVVVLLLLLLLL
jgi:hypothetical protein